MKHFRQRVTTTASPFPQVGPVRLMAILLFCVSAFFAGACGGAEGTDTAAQPNIIFILADDFGRELLPAYGGTSYVTPVLDSMAESGLLFQTCYATPLCAPSRNMFLSGQYNFRNYTDWDEMDFSIRTIAHYMRDAGYVTGMAGKWHRGGWRQEPRGPAKAGFMEYCSYDYLEYNTARKKDENCYWGTTLWQDGGEIKLGKDQSTSEYFNQYVTDFIRRHKNKPFFFYYPMNLVHRPFVITPDQLSVSHAADTSNLSRSAGKAENFAAMVSYADKLVGRVIETLKEEDLLENSIIMFAGDNGTDNIREASDVVSGFRGGYVKGGKYFPTELGVNVPFIIYAPGYVTTGGRIASPVDFTDLLPTCYDLSGNAGGEMVTDGRSFASLIHGRGDYHPRTWVYSYGNFDNHSGKYKDPVRYSDGFYGVMSDGAWKYYSDNRLFNVREDILERHEIPDGYSAESDLIRKRLKDNLDSLRNTLPRLW